MPDFVLNRSKSVRFFELPDRFWMSPDRFLQSPGRISGEPIELHVKIKLSGDPIGFRLTRSVFGSVRFAFLFNRNFSVRIGWSSFRFSVRFDWKYFSTETFRFGSVARNFQPKIFSSDRLGPKFQPKFSVRFGFGSVWRNNRTEASLNLATKRNDDTYLHFTRVSKCYESMDFLLLHFPMK